MTDYRRREAPRPLATPEEAEAWTAKTIGGYPRGSLARCNTSPQHDQRKPIRWWLRCCGVSGDLTKTLTAETLAAAWNDTSGMVLDDLRTRAPAPTVPTVTPCQDNPPVLLNLIHKEEQPTRAPLPSLPLPTPAAALPQDATSNLAAALAAVMQAHQPAAAPISAEDLRDAVTAEMSRQLDNLLSAPRALSVTIGTATHTLPKAPRHPRFDTLLTLCANAGLPGALSPYLVGPAGSGKTTACEHAAEALGLPFYTLGALTGAHELLGYKDAAGTYHTTPFRQAFECGGLFLADEADRSDPAALIALNSAIANGFAGFPDRAEPVRRHADFRLCVAANTFGTGADRQYVGANQLDASTLDRFATLAWDYDESLERALAGHDAWTAYVQAVRASLDRSKVRHIVSPRASIGGAIYLRAGLPWQQVADMVIWKGLDAETRRRIEETTSSAARTLAA
jgi:cobaltochelatase CobS